MSEIYTGNGRKKAMSSNQFRKWLQQLAQSYKKSESIRSASEQEHKKEEQQADKELVTKLENLSS